MSTRDSTFSYVHIDNPNQVLYMEKWHDEPIPFDDIDTHALVEATSNLFPQILLEDEDDSGIPINLSIFGAKVFKNRNLMKEKVWTDLNIDKFLKEERPPDNTVLKSIYTKLDTNGLTISDFLSNGFAHQPDPVFSPPSIDHSTTEFLPNNTFFRSNSTDGSQVLHTPRVGRTRQPSTDKLQTPITRTMR